jgi:hypothetical protein
LAKTPTASVLILTIHPLPENSTEEFLSCVKESRGKIGPGLVKSWQFVFSPNLDPDLRSVTSDIVRDAPIFDDWEFFSVRQPKQWEYKFELAAGNGKRLKIDASEWRFVLLRYPDSQHEIVLEGKDAPDLNDDEAWQAAAIALESILGEDILMNGAIQFSLLRHLPTRDGKRGKANSTAIWCDEYRKRAKKIMPLSEWCRYSDPNGENLS